MRRTKTDASVFLLVAIALLFFGGGAAALYTLRSDPAEEALSGDRVTNVLYVIEKGGKPLCTYVLMYYPATKRAAVFDIPGELGLLLRRINRVDRIDTVYAPGRVSAYESEIENLLGIDIVFSVVITQENLGRAVDLLEGVDIFIPTPVNIREGGSPVLFPSGMTRLDGNKAVVYASYEVPEESREMAVSRRQRFFMSFLKRQGEMSGILKNPATAQMYYSFLNTNMTQRASVRLFGEFVSIDTDRTGIQSVGGNSREVSGQMLLIPHYDGSLVKEIVRQTLGALTRPSDGVQSDRVFTVEVLNGTTVSGLAGRTAELLRSFGYDVISIGNAGHADYEKTEIRDRSGYGDTAQTLAEIIRCRNIHAETPLGGNPDEDIAIQGFEYRSDFTVIIGRDFNGRYVTGN